MATCGVGFAVLFSIVATFTYANLLLAAPPYRLGPAELGSIFVVYLLGAMITPPAARLAIRFGRRRTVLLAGLVAAVGVLLTLTHSLGLIILGLSMLAVGVFTEQMISINYVAIAGERARSTAVGLFVTCYYLGGAIGGIAPASIWSHSWLARLRHAGAGGAGGRGQRHLAGLAAHPGFTVDQDAQSLPQPRRETHSMNIAFKPNLEKFAVGQPVSRKEDPALLRGEGRYTDDLNLAGQVYAVFVRSRYAHGAIRSVDAAEAETMPGVLAVLTAQDLEAGGIKPMPAASGTNADGTPTPKPRQMALASGKVRYVGDPIACVVAETAKGRARRGGGGDGRDRPAACRDQRPRSRRRGRADAA